MTDRADLEVKRKLPESYPEEEYNGSLERLKEFAERFDPQTIKDFDELSAETSSVGEDLKIAINGGGEVVKRKVSFPHFRGGLMEWEEWDRVIKGQDGDTRVYANVWQDEVNHSRDNVGIHLATDQRQVDLAIPIYTGEYSIDTQVDLLPFLKIKEGDKETNFTLNMSDEEAERFGDISKPEGTKAYAEAIKLAVASVVNLSSKKQ